MATTALALPTTERAYRTEPSPLGFLRRSAHVFPDEVAVVQRQAVARVQGSPRRALPRVDATPPAQHRHRRKRSRRPLPHNPTPEVPARALLEAHFAVPAACAVLVAINTRLAAGEVAYILEHSGARLVFCDHELLPLVQGCSRQRSCPRAGARRVHLSRLPGGS